jgi:hypothetical protein
MGWANCGTDEDGRPIGYGHEAICDQPGCSAKIDRGLSYVCGNMHGGGDLGCGKYFCSGHLICVEVNDGSSDQLCDNCHRIAEAEGCLADN